METEQPELGMIAISSDLASPLVSKIVNINYLQEASPEEQVFKEYVDIHKIPGVVEKGVVDLVVCGPKGKPKHVFFLVSTLSDVTSMRTDAWSAIAGVDDIPTGLTCSINGRSHYVTASWKVGRTDVQD